MDALRKINREDGITVLCNLHTLDTAKVYCERIIGMKQGAFVFDGPPSDLNLDMLRGIYGVGEDEDDEEFSTAITSTSIQMATDKLDKKKRKKVAAQ
jgi:phosphonate transport system ATP-binding protein